MDTVKMKYHGPGSDADARQVEVSEAEAASLKKTGLWSEVKTKAKKKVDDDKKESS